MAVDKTELREAIEALQDNDLGPNKTRLVSQAIDAVQGIVPLVVLAVVLVVVL